MLHQYIKGEYEHGKKQLYRSLRRSSQNRKNIIQIFLGAFVGGVYRIIRFLETKNVTTLVVGILALIPPIDFVFWIIDLVTEIMNNKITVLAD